MRIALPFVCALFLVPTVHARVLGTNTPAQSLTAQRIRTTLPKAQQAEWLAYLDRSAKREAADRAAFAAEMKAAGKTEPVMPKAGFAARSVPFDKDAGWYASDEAIQIADTVVSFQLPNGGWSKNLDMRQPPRVPGESYAADNLSKYPDSTDFDAPHDPTWNYMGTLDNDATNTELKFLRLVIAAAPAEKAKTYQAAYLRGIEYLLVSQFPNGGWPQVWPLEGGYHDAITFNDDAVTESLESLQPVAFGEVKFVPLAIQVRAVVAFGRGIRCILALQIMVNGKKTIWAQQQDALTLAPVAGRNFEPPALASSESADVLLFLMGLPTYKPKEDAEVAKAIEAGVAWFRNGAITGYVYGGTRATGGRKLTKQDGAGPIWARYYSLTTNTPVFGDRDKTIHDDVADLSPERRNGYAWYNAEGVAVLEKYAEWKRSHP